MNNLLTWIKDNPIRSMFLVPIFLVAGISISHVVAWYDITNPISWAIYLSIAIEIGAITALIAATQRIKGGVWFMFGVVTFVQMVGNIFYSYKEIDPTGDLFKSWVELTSPIFEMFGTEPTDIIAHKRWLAILGGGLLPVISLTSLHFFVKYEEPEKSTLVNFENDRDLEIASLMDLEILEKEEENDIEVEKPKSKRGRKKKEVEETKDEDNEVDLPEPIEPIVTDEPEIPLSDVLESQDNEELDDVIETPVVEASIVETPIIEVPIVETPIIEVPVVETPKPKRPTKLTYTKPNVTIDRPL